ncbi:MAG: aldo/keto reductase [Candidatus Rokubacteria bacterium]|nr:aldo/keto reductase [Candidatus Rokubacteria bacterium]
MIGIRPLAGGALSGVADRHPIATRTVEPIATGPDYLTDVRRAQRFRILVEEGHAASLVEAALRLAIATDAMSTVLVGYSSLEHLEAAAAAVGRGPLPPAALERLAAVWRELTSDG